MPKKNQSQPKLERVMLDREHAEAHLRLGSGLSPPREVEISRQVHAAVGLMRRGRIGGD